MNIIKTLEHQGVSIKIIQDEDAESPQAWGDTGLFIIANHRQFFVPEPGEKSIPHEWAVYLETYKKTHWIFPLEAYIHSGVRLALSHTGNFPDRQWDVSQVGGVFVSKKEWRLSAKAREAAVNHVETWNQYLSGDVYGYIVGKSEDSCWGFYGLDYCIEQAKEVAEHIALDALCSLC